MSPDPGSPEWWFQKLLARFDAWEPDRSTSDGTVIRETRRQRFDRLWSYHTGNAPLPQVAEQYTDVFRAVMRKARCNYAPIAVNALRSRMVLVGVSTAKDNDTGGDDLAAEIAEVSALETGLQDMLAYLFVMSEAYGMVVAPKPGSNTKPMIAALDPRNAVGDPDPSNPNLLRALLVRSVDEMFGTETMQLFLPGKRYEIQRKLAGSGLVNVSSKWDWVGEYDVSDIDHLGGIPAVRLDNEYGLGEFEPHTDLLDRINDVTLQRIVIVWYQSFRQRAVSGDLEGDSDDDDIDEPPDWDEVFRADPGSLWRVPEGVEFWESAPTDIGPILQAKRDDVKEFGVVTNTPLHLFSPDSANQTAEGASLTREGHDFKVKDRRARVAPKIKMLFRMAFSMAGEPERGTGLRLQWGALENNSLADKGSASAQTKGVLSQKNQLVKIWGMTPKEAEENITQLAGEQLLALSTAATVAGAAQQPDPQDPAAP
ncbi:phage portal protein [Nocardia cyriacigeorgica]|uniref:phage portal protein n=1 Tax=Nocardia cyriacigeorgica TaxID=135487 RepID=UPI0024546D2C|nr:phage portal protein [Nocardia cyriacigeorgica]